MLLLLLQLASNSSEFVSSLTFAAKKRWKNMSLTLSQVRGGRVGGTAREVVCAREGWAQMGRAIPPC